MKKIILTLLVVTALNSCKDKKENIEASNVKVETNKTTVPEVVTETVPEEVIENTENNKNQKLEAAVESTSKTVVTTTQLEQVVSNFQNCKAVSTKRADCRNAFTKFISNTYQLSEFKDKNGGYKIYDSIQPIVSKSNNWKKIGIATNQKQIDKAIKYANNGDLVLIIDTSNTYGQVAMVQAGESKKSGSWGLKLPNVLSLANHNASKSFQGKSLAYAFKKSEDLQIYLRK